METVLLKAHIWLVAAMVPLADRALSLKCLLQLFTPPVRLAPYRHSDIESICAIISRRLEKPRQMKRRKCLRHGLVLYHFLCLTGRNPTLILGVYPWQEDRRDLAHCWVELDGRELSPGPDGPVAELLHHSRAKRS